MSSRAELKQKAKNLLDGKKGKGALMTFLYYLMPFLFAFIPFVGPVVNIICMPVLTYGLLKALIDLKNGEEVGAFDFFTKGFKDFGLIDLPFPLRSLRSLRPCCRPWCLHVLQPAECFRW